MVTFLAYAREGFEGSLAVILCEDHGSIPIDINADDNGCAQATPLGLSASLGQGDVQSQRVCSFAEPSERYTGLMALRHPDAIQAVEVDGKTYVITANEGDDKAPIH